MNKDLAKLDSEQLRKALEKLGIPANELAKLLKKAAAARKASQQSQKLSEALADAAKSHGEEWPEVLKGSPIGETPVIRPSKK